MYFKVFFYKKLFFLLQKKYDIIKKYREKSQYINEQLKKLRERVGN